MWTCEQCGCQAIAPGIPFCPQCFKPREDDMPKVTSGGYTNAAEGGPAEPGTGAAENQPQAPAKPAADAETPKPDKPSEAVSGPQQAEPDAGA